MMKNPRMMIAAAGLSAAALGGGVGIVAITANSTPLAAATSVTFEQAPGPFASSSPPVITEVATLSTSTVATVHTAKVKVGEATETILVNAKGFPLYFYKPDTASKSKVTGALAALWPPLDARHPTASGASGVLSTVFTDNRHQVAYKGHFLYTFEEDGTRHVTGQGVEDFFVATPRIAVNHNTAVTSRTAAPAPSNRGYGY